MCQSHMEAPAGAATMWLWLELGEVREGGGADGVGGGGGAAVRNGDPERVVAWSGEGR